jgi:hypothetical protein
MTRFQGSPGAFWPGGRKAKPTRVMTYFLSLLCLGVIWGWGGWVWVEVGVEVGVGSGEEKRAAAGEWVEIELGMAARRR